MTVKPVLSLDEQPLQPRPAQYRPGGAAGERFELTRATLGATLGLKKLGCSLTEVPPGKTGYPFHSHRVNDEMFYIIAGRGELRLGDARHPVAAGDLIGCPCGGPATAHQLINTGSVPLRYLAISSELDPEVCEYPDSGKIGVWAAEPGGPGLMHLTRASAKVDYWDGE
ncbi:cupin domain-containing protein [Ideonella sp.]|uniref:cupin domain-containing protein n=1 Tax=Ideonella sp. TaxID=1929293 RepID=UPI002B4A67D8|nr:cupin domain-containing protein [Ideonella sp.]HJV71188.1 cupin domain-containing protein [Ideonella sp.]